MGRFRRKTFEVDAVQFTADLTHADLFKFAGCDCKKASDGSPFRFDAGGVYVRRLDGSEDNVKPGGWIVRDPANGFLGHDAASFAKFFEPVPNDTKEVVGSIAPVSAPEQPTG